MAKKHALGKPPSQRGDRAAEALPNGYDPNDLRYIALHAAGHAVSAVVLGMNLKKVDIKKRLTDRGMSVGFTDSGRFDVKDMAEKLQSSRCRI